MEETQARPAGPAPTMQTSYSLDEDGMVVLDCERISGNEWVLMLWLLVQAGVKWRESTETEDESLHFFAHFG